MLIECLIDIYLPAGYLCEHPPRRNALQKSTLAGHINTYPSLKEPLTGLINLKLHVH